MLIEKFEQQVEQTPGNNAVVAPVSADSNGTATQITYLQLNQKANRLGHLILSRLPRAETGETHHAALLMEKGIDLIAAMLGVLKAGMAYVPLDPGYPVNRLIYMLENSRSMLIVTNKKNLRLAEAASGKVKGKITVIVIDDPVSRLTNFPGSNPERQPSGEGRAYILYTSGSTGQPKGVVQNHGNVLYYVRNWIRIFSIRATDRMTLLTTFTHDGAMQDIFASLFAGATLYPFDIKTIVEQHELVDFVRHNQITLWHSVPTLYRYFCECLGAKVKFPRLRAIILGGEPLREHDVELLKKYFPHAFMANVYGQTESSVSTICLIDANAPFKKVTLGRPLDETEVLLVDEDDEILEDMGSGEIVILSNYLAPGYWQDAVATEKNFSHDPELGSMYWTGDLGAYLGSGAIEILGRKDFQVKIRGFRVETGEIESRLLSHHDIKEAVVTAHDDDAGNASTRATGEKYLCAYIVAQDPVSKEPDSTTLREYLFETLPDYMAPTHFVWLEKMPLTPTGKINRKALPLPMESETAPVFVPPQTDTEKILAKIWFDVLFGANHSYPAIGREDNFFQMGGHSLRAMTVISRLHKELNVKVELEDVFNYPTLKGLAARLPAAEEKKFQVIPIAEDLEYYPLSAAQKRLYILQQMDKKSTGYNTPVAVVIEGSVQREKLAKTFRALIHRHESFRTSFIMKDGEPRQRILPQVTFAVEDALSVESFIVPFDLAEAPLLRVGFVHELNVLIMDMHHIICDGNSAAILVSEFMALYRLEKFGPMKLRYRDYSQWQQSPPQQARLDNQKSFWLSQFSAHIEPLELPYDFPRPPVQSFAGDRVRATLEPAITAGLKELAEKEDVTLFMLLLALFNVLLAKLSGEQEIIVGTPVAGRRHADLEPVIGMFVNTLALKNHCSGKNTFLQLLQSVKKKSLAALENQEFQFEDLVDLLRLNRDAGRNPLFDILFTFRTSEARNIDDAGLNVRPYPFRNKTSKFDLSLDAAENRDELALTMEYCTRLFKESTVLRFLRYFQVIALQVSREPAKRLDCISLLDRKEKETLLEMCNGARETGYIDRTICDLFQNSVEQSPDNVALVMGREFVTYDRLNRSANRLAHRLRLKNIRRDDTVGLMTEPSITTVIAMLAVIKAGAAYLPIAPELPTARKRFMIKDSNIDILLTNCTHLTGLENISFEVLDIDSDFEKNNEENKNPADEKNRVSVTDASGLLYIIYTSGSTGTPKGVMLEHRNLVNLLEYQYTHTSIDFSSVLQFTTISFDVSFQEIFSTLCAAGSLTLVDRETRGNVPRLFKVIHDNCVKTLFWPVSFLKFIFTDERFAAKIPTGIRHIVTAGEQLIVTPLLRDYMAHNNVQLHNHYGPSETHVVTTLTLVSDDPQIPEIPERPPIGKPVSNTSIYILDSGKEHLQPIGVAGELCITGISVGRGYLNRPELNTEKFVNSDKSFYGAFFQKRPNGEKTLIPAGDTTVSVDLEFVLYSTGDRARWMEDGNIEFLGRLDQQLKIRGFRVEPGEIEKHLMEIPLIKDAVVVPLQDENRGTYLCAYMVPSAGKETLDTESIRDNLHQQLPDYMVPAHFVCLEKIPLTTSRKIDRRALPQPGFQAEKPRSTDATSYEQHILDIWCGILGGKNQNADAFKNSLAVDDNLFQRGGNSLDLIKLASLLYQEYEVEIPVLQLFENPTIREITRMTLDYRLDRNQEEAITVMNPGKDKKIFCFPPGIGYGFVYSDLSLQLPDYTFCAFNYIEAEDRIERYIELMHQYQPHGPYLMLAYSAGGELAVVVAQHLEKKGETVSAILLLDCYRTYGKIEENRLQGFMATVEQSMAALGVSYLKEKIMKKVRGYSDYFDHLPPLKPIRAHLYLITADDRKERETVGERETWAQLSLTTFKQHSGSGIHARMLEGEHLIKNVVIIERILSGIQRPASPARKEKGDG